MNKEKFTHIDNTTEMPMLLKMTEKEIKLFLYISSKMTFKQSIYGIFSKQPPSKIVKVLGFRDSTHLKQTLNKLEKSGVLFVVNFKENLILSKTKLTLEELKHKIELNFTDFNIRADRLKELKDFFKWQIDFKAIYGKKVPEATQAPNFPIKTLQSAANDSIPEEISLDWDEALKKRDSYNNWLNSNR